MFQNTSPEYKIAAERAIYAAWAKRSPLIGKYDVLAVNWVNFEAKIKALQGKAKKLGTAPISYKNLGTFMGKTFYNGKHVMMRKHRVLVYGETAEINGWELVAILQHNLGDGTVIREIPGAGVEIPVQYRDAAPHCDHCKTNRRRGDTFVIYNARTGKFAQVGSNCLKDFTGGNNPKHVAAVAQYLHEINLAALEAGRLANMPFIDVERFLTFVVASMRIDGWVSRAAAKEGNGIATADVAVDYMMKSPDKIVTNAADDKLAANALAWVRGGCGKANRADRSSYEHDLTVIMADELITSREIGYVASAINAYRKYLEEQSKPAAPVSQFVGTVGKRDKFGPLTCNLVIEIDGAYGIVYLTKLTDSAGNELVWFSSSDCLTVGAAYEGMATVKDHNVRNDVNQTILTRCKFTEVGAS